MRFDVKSMYFKAILAFCAVAGLTFGQSALAQAPSAATASAAKDAKDTKQRSNSPLSGFGSQNKDPYKIDANKLEVQQKENRAIYSGDVVVIQGKTTMRCTELIIFFDQKTPDAKAGAQKTSANGAQPAAPGTTPGAGGLKRLECHGPVSVTQEKQNATSEFLVYEADIITLTGNVLVSDGDNIQAGEKLVYNTKSGIGTMEGQKGGRVRGIFVPGTGEQKDPAKKAADKKAKTG